MSIRLHHAATTGSSGVKRKRAASHDAAHKLLQEYLGFCLKLDVLYYTGEVPYEYILSDDVIDRVVSLSDQEDRR